MSCLSYAGREACGSLSQGSWEGIKAMLFPLLVPPLLFLSTWKAQAAP